MTPALICFALEEEAAPFRKFASARPGVLICITGIGRKNAETAVSGILAREKPAFVLTCGFAGGLNPTLATGDVIVSTEDGMLQEKLLAVGAKSSVFFCASRIATTVAEKQELRRTTGADAVEMESQAIQTVCREHGIPCATVRVISDPAQVDLPLDFNSLSKADLSLDYGKLLLAVAKSPEKIPALLRLQKNCRFAADKLADTLAKMIWPA